ncbi:MAG: hypothetical protein E7346_06645 [Clostridiales bacterium]|nr:hypothetical protein [Clostridiales bacterium]
MIKIIDIDELFDKYISDYVYKNIGKVKPEEIENRIPELYVEFGDKSLKDLDGKTPNTFYKDYSGEELLECLKGHLNKGVAVSDFLCEAITGNKKNEDALCKELKQDNDEEFTLYLMNMLSDMNSEKAADRYLEFVLWDYSEVIRELATELLCGFAERVKEKILAQFKDVEESKKVNLTEILSNCKNDDRVFDILVAEFMKHQENIPVYAGYLSKFGDERAIPFLTVAIEKEKISYADFEELRFAIETLGGEYTKERDFSADKTYKRIKNVKNEKLIN